MHGRPDGIVLAALLIGLFVQLFVDRRCGITLRHHVVFARDLDTVLDAGTIAVLLAYGFEQRLELIVVAVGIKHEASAGQRERIGRRQSCTRIEAPRAHLP